MADPGYWPWWAVAPPLGAITVAFWLVVRRPLGLSGIIGRFARLREELATERGLRAEPGTDAAAEAALLAATLEAFGPEAVAAAELQGRAAGQLPPAEGQAASESTGRALGPKPFLAVHALFLAAVVLGALAAAAWRGQLRAEAGLGAEFARIMGTGAAPPLALLGGGVLVGLGATLCGGCSAGHGLSGCSRLQPGSLLATCSFLAGAILTSLALGALL